MPFKPCEAVIDRVLCIPPCYKQRTMSFMVARRNKRKKCEAADFVNTVGNYMPKLRYTNKTTLQCTLVTGDIERRVCRKEFAYDEFTESLKYVNPGATDLLREIETREPSRFSELGTSHVFGHAFLITRHALWSGYTIEPHVPNGLIDDVFEYAVLTRL